YICSGNPHIDNLFVCKKIESSSIWIGTQHLLWESKNYISWLYTDKNSSIIFEVTPFYPFMYSDTKKKLHYISFESWMKRYKPYLISIIPKETAHKWITQANCITQQIEANINRWKQEEKKHNL